jgi:hypothetical protein
MVLAAFDPTLLLAPFILVMLGLAALTWIAMLGGSLQFALWLLVDDPPRYLRCLAMALLIAVVNITIFAGFYLILGPQPWYVVVCYQAMVQIFLVMAMARCNPFQAFFAALCHSVFSTVGTLIVCLVLFLTCGSAVRGAIEQKREIARQSGAVEVVNPFVQ